MARLPHPGLAYSVIDTNYTRKEYSLKIRIKFGLLGHLVLYEVVNWINEGKGCYAEYTDDTAATFAMTRLGALEHAEKVEEIFRYMLEIGFFDRGAFARDKILTSEGLVKRWALAKRRPESFEMPPSVQEILNTLKKEAGTENEPKRTENEPKCTETAPEFPQTEPKRTQSKVKESKVKEVLKNKQTNKQTNCEIETIKKAKESPRWEEVRLEIVRLIYEPGLSSDLVDAITAAAVQKWIGKNQVRAWLRKAGDELEVSRRTDQRHGKTRLWATLRPWIEEIYNTYGITLPSCNPRNKEPPPPPVRTPPEILADTEQSQKAASRAMMPR